MTQHIYLSSCCLATSKDVKTVLDTYADAGVSNVELSSCHPHTPDVLNLVQSYNFKYLVHNYFPPPREPFFSNFSSTDQAVRKKSMTLAKEAIVLCTKIGSPLYTVHSGFRQDVGSGINFDQNKAITPYDKAIAIFSTSMRELVAFAHDHGVKIAFENQPALTPRGNVSEFITFNKAEEYTTLINDIGPEKIGMLLDVAHLENSATVLGFDLDTFIENVKDLVLEVHACQNKPDGVHAHLPLQPGNKLLQTLKKFSHVPITLEVSSDMQTLLEQIKLVQNNVN